MANQIACIWTDYLGNGSINDPYRPRFMDIIQPNEIIAFNLVDLISTISNNYPELVFPDASVVEKHEVPLGGFEPKICAAYVYADSTRIQSAFLSSNYFVSWTYTIDRNDFIALTDKLPNENTIDTEVTTYLDWLSLKIGKTKSSITTWLKSQFNVSTNAEALNWITTHPRSNFISKMAKAFQIWSNVNEEIV